MTTDIDKKINEMLSIVQKHKKEIENAEKSIERHWVTNASFKFHDKTPLNLQSANEASIFKAMIELLNFSNSAKQANEILGINQPIKYESYSFEEWTQDFKKRIAILNINSKKEKLKQLESRLSSIVSEDQKRQMELDAIAKELE